jgi:hypothetical protein
MALCQGSHRRNGIAPNAARRTEPKPVGISLLNGQAANIPYLMLGSAVSSSTPNDFQPKPHIGLSVVPLMSW